MKPSPKPIAFFAAMAWARLERERCVAAVMADG